MVVDDSVVVRGMLARALENDPGITVVASVGNGQIAVSTLQHEPVDVIVLDVEMPVMDGLTAIPLLLKVMPSVKIIMASTLTQRNAEISIRALEAGATDYIAKPQATRDMGSTSIFRQEFVTKVRALGDAARRGKSHIDAMSGVRERAAPAPREVVKPVITLRSMPVIPQRPDAIAIGSSTGGPQALMKVLERLAHNGPPLTQPVLMTQHMPATFTSILAEHISRQCGIPCTEAKEGEIIQGGHFYVAPGDNHMTIDRDLARNQICVRLNKDAPENFCRPSVDPMLRSMTKIYGRKLLTVILTGMGSDGCKGCESVVAEGGIVLAQDEASSVVWGMPGAVAVAGLCTAILPLDQIADSIRRLATGGAG
ncbi:MAG: chemotaxis response regulator protein-glutamate methylesterase [Alphaproteobacteria bacterium]|nr:MAG: chemotaxis response regulator protein-glutamate methylesterase [Alphaproteobacteria bacterium]